RTLGPPGHQPTRLPWDLTDGASYHRPPHGEGLEGAMRRVSLLALCVAAALAASACGGDDGGSGGSAGSADDTAPRGLAAIHTVDALEPLVQGLADAYNANSDAPV